MLGRHARPPSHALDLTRPLHPVAMPSLRPWAGRRLGDGVGESWVAGPASRVPLPDGSAPTLDELASLSGADLVGSAGMAALGGRFPLLAKLIDAADWLSLQVHPDDDLARRLFGADAVGKDECWVVLAADRGTRLVVGPRDGLDHDGVLVAVTAGEMGLDDLAVHDAAPGDVLDVRAGTIHAIGPGAFIYELEQPSDITFRVSDWGRPPTPERPLHPVEARQALVRSARAAIAGRGWRVDAQVLEERHFRLEIVTGPDACVRRPSGRSLEVVTAVGAPVALAGDGWSEQLAPLETAVVPAAVPAYTIAPSEGGRALVGSLPS